MKLIDPQGVMRTRGRTKNERYSYSVLIVLTVRKIFAGTANGVVNLAYRMAAAEITVSYLSYFSQSSHLHSDDCDFTFLSL